MSDKQGKGERVLTSFQQWKKSAHMWSSQQLGGEEFSQVEVVCLLDLGPLSSDPKEESVGYAMQEGSQFTSRRGSPSTLSFQCHQVLPVLCYFITGDSAAEV